jgi:hypothetical protein
MREKKKKVWNLYAQIDAALGKIWKHCPQRRHALESAVVDASAPTRARKYKCAMCNGHFSQMETDIDHLSDGHGKDETHEQHIERRFLSMYKIEGDLTDAEKFWIEGHLRAVCFVCHKKNTAEQRSRATQERREAKAKEKQLVKEKRKKK